jgi:hypothetical protein
MNLTRRLTWSSYRTLILRCMANARTGPAATGTVSV